MISAFNDAIITGGNVPMTVLGRVVDRVRGKGAGLGYSVSRRNR